MSGDRTFDVAPAKLNLALHVRGVRPDGRHEIETLFAFCVDGDRVGVTFDEALTLTVSGPFARDLGDPDDNLALRAARALKERSGVKEGASISLEKRLPVASGLGGGSADAAAVLRLLTALWGLDPALAQEVAPLLGSDVPACLLSLTARGTGAGDQLTLISLPELSGTAILLVNPRVRLSTAQVFAGWDGTDGGPLGDWRLGGNELEAPAKALAPQIASVLAWLGTRLGASLARMSGSGATCFALFESDEARDLAADSVPREWWRLATSLR